MKTTLDLPDDLLIEAKAVAARRKTTLKTLVEHALRREIFPESSQENPDPGKFEIGPFGILRLKRRPGHTLTPEQIQAIQDELDAEEAERLLGRPQS